MYSLVITTSYEAAKAIASVVGAKRTNYKWFENDNYTIVAIPTALIRLSSPDNYLEKNWGGKWNLNSLPIVPEDMQLEVAQTDEAQECMGYIEECLQSEKYDQVIHAGSTDRDGELAVRRVIEWFESELPLKRLWYTSIESTAIKEALNNLEDDAKYDGLANAAYGRQAADWYVGYNATRALTVVNNKSYAIGRNSAMVLHLIAERTKYNAGFKAIPFWTIRTQAGGLAFETERYYAEQDAIKDSAAINNRPLIIDEINTLESTKKPPKLYTLTALQRDASKYYNIGAKEALDGLTVLFKGGYITQPITNATAINGEELKLIEQLVDLGIPQCICELDDDTNLDSDKLAVGNEGIGSSTILPTIRLTHDAYVSMSEAQQRLAYLICTRLLIVLQGQPAKYKRVDIEARCAEIVFKCIENQRVEGGWEKLSDELLSAKKEKLPFELPYELKKGSALRQDELAIEIHQGATTAPQPLTDDILLSYLENPGKFLDDPKLKTAIKNSNSGSAGIGTAITRTEAIASLLTRGYIERKDGALFATKEGMELDRLLPEMLKSPSLTAQWKYDLDRVENGELELSDFIDKTIAFTCELVKEIEQGVTSNNASLNTYGKCPRCGQNIIKNNKGNGWHCSSFKAAGNKYEGCGYRLYKNCLGHMITDAESRRLLQNKTVVVSDCKDKDGNKRRAQLVVDKNNNFGVRVIFDKDAAPYTNTVKPEAYKTVSAKKAKPDDSKEAPKFSDEEIYDFIKELAKEKAEEDAKKDDELWGERPEFPKTQAEVLEMLKWAAETKRTGKAQARPSFMSRHS